jgi:hypothetical protein
MLKAAVCVEGIATETPLVADPIAGKGRHLD